MLMVLPDHEGADIRQIIIDVVSIMRSEAPMGPDFRLKSPRMPPRGGDSKGVGGCRKERVLSSRGKSR